MYKIGKCIICNSDIVFLKKPRINFNKCMTCYNKEMRHKYYIAHKEHERSTNKRWLKDNAKKRSIYNTKRVIEKRKNDIAYKIKDNYKKRISIALRGNKKLGTTEYLLGCTFFEFKNYLEILFGPGMSWENYGYWGWHIDHIIPCSAFDLSKKEEQSKCFNYKNTRPLWMKENFSHGGKNRCRVKYSVSAAMKDF